MAKVSRAYIKGTGADQSGSIQAGSTIYAQDILDLIDSAKWHDEGIESVSYDDSSHSLKVVKSSDPNNPVHFPVPKNSDIVNKLVKGVDKYELHSDSGLVAETDLPSTLVTSVTCDKNANELQVSSTSSDSGITVPLPDSLKSASIEGNDINFTSLDGRQSVINLPDSLKSVTIEGNTLTFTSLDGTPSVINLPVTTGYLSDVSLEDGTLVFTKDGSSDVRVTLPFVSKAINGVSLQDSNLVFTFSDNTSANIALPTQSEGGTTAGLLSGVRIDGNRLIFTVSGGNDITIELPSTPGGSGDVDLTGLLYNPSYSQGILYFAAKYGNLASVDIPGVLRIDGLSGENLEYTDVKGLSHMVTLRNLTKGVLNGASVSGDNLVFTTEGSGNISIPLSSITGGVLTGVSLSDGNLVFTVKGGDNISIPLNGGALEDVTITDDNKLSVTKGSETTKYPILPTCVTDYSGQGTHSGWGGALAYTPAGSSDARPYAPLWVPNRLRHMSDVIESSADFSEYRELPVDSRESVGFGYIYGNSYVSADGRYITNDSAVISFIYCYTKLTESFSESSGTFTANVITKGYTNEDYVLIDSSIRFALTSNILEAFPERQVDSLVHLLASSGRLTNFKGFAFRIGYYIILIDKSMFFAKQVFDWSYNVTNTFGMKVSLGNRIIRNDLYGLFYAKTGKVLD